LPRLAAIHCGVLPSRVGGAVIAVREPPSAGANSESDEAKMPFEILLLSFLLL
jgi:hypothetical protein